MSIRYQRVTFENPAETLMLPRSIERNWMIHGSGFVPRYYRFQQLSNHRRFVTDGRLVGGVRHYRRAWGSVTQTARPSFPCPRSYRVRPAAGAMDSFGVEWPDPRLEQIMALTAGTRLGHYDVSALIGGGGMGSSRCTPIR